MPHYKKNPHYGTEREWLFGNVKKHYLKKKLWAINLMSDALEQPSVYESLISHNSQEAVY